MGGSLQSFLDSIFADRDRNRKRNFKLSGAASGSTQFCTEHLFKSNARSKQIMDELGDFGDAQAALLLLKHCTGFCQPACSTRTVPTERQAEGADDYADNLKRSLQTTLRRPVDERGWAQAQLAVKEGGLWLRGPSKHVVAAFVASTWRH